MHIYIHIYVNKQLNMYSFPRRYEKNCTRAYRHKHIGNKNVKKSLTY